MRPLWRVADLIADENRHHDRDGAHSEALAKTSLRGSSPGAADAIADAGVQQAVQAASTPHLEGRNISAHRQQPPSGSYAQQISCSRKHTAAALGHYAPKVERPDRARCRVRVHGRLRSMEQNF